MRKCFVIQPFDNDKFDKRYTDIFKPAIENADLFSYRIDKDLSVRIPIDEIEKNIYDSAICFAEITTDNPNVWYELGFAFACGKDVVLVCSEEREDKFPFDIQHRHIITYKTGSKSDFEKLEDTITKKIKAILQSSRVIKTLNSTPVVEKEGLKSHEIALLIFMAENQFTSEESISVWNLKNAMNNAGYTDIATSVGIRTLIKKELVISSRESDRWGNGDEYTALRLSEKGENWILNNQDQFVFRMEKPNPTNSSQKVIDDLPF